MSRTLRQALGNQRKNMMLVPKSVLVHYVKQREFLWIVIGAITGAITSESTRFIMWIWSNDG